jgi:GNAT superfamily N-acetyltransferase
VSAEVEVGVCDDVAVLTALRRAWNEEDFGAVDDPEFDDRFETWFEAERDTRTFFVVTVDGAPVGMANIKRYTRMPVVGRASAGWWGYVGNVFVRPEHRNGGVGAVLMRALTDWAREHGYERLRLAPSERARPFYERLGYVPGAVIQLNP